MATTLRNKRHNIVSRLLERPYDFDFIEAVRILLVNKKLNLDRIKFHVVSDLKYTNRNVIRVEEKKGFYHVYTNLMGLVGINGFLPTHYTMLIREQIHQGDSDFVDFLDVFHNRFLSQVYRAWSVNHFYVNRKVGFIEDSFKRNLLGLAGGDLKSIKKSLPFDTDCVAFYASYFFSQRRSAQNLKNILASFFCIPVKIEEFQIQRFSIHEDDLGFLSKSRLGVDSSIGEHILARMGRIKVIMGPLSKDEFHDLFPRSKNYTTLSNIVRYYVGEFISFDIELILKAEDIVFCKMGDINARLGYSWCCKKENAKNQSIQFFGGE